MARGAAHNGGTCSCSWPSSHVRRRPRQAPRWVAQNGSQPSLAVEREMLASTHPDAVRRRREAEQRRAVLRQEMASVSHVNWWEGELPANLLTAASPEAFRRVVATHRLVVADFWVPWCNGCRRLYPKLKQIAANNPEVTFLSVNGADTALTDFVASDLGIDRLPFFHLYRCGELRAGFAANLSKLAQLRAEIAFLKACSEPACSV